MKQAAEGCNFSGWGEESREERRKAREVNEGEGLSKDSGGYEQMQGRRMGPKERSLRNLGGEESPKKRPIGVESS